MPLQRRDGQWFALPRRRYVLLICCDCGLTHKVAGRTTPTGRIRLVFARSETETRSSRRTLRRRLTFVRRRTRRRHGR